jgi:HEAT repeat protein
MTVENALMSENPSVRVRAAMAMGTDPDPRYVDLLAARCAVEPDFHVRETLTWALVRHPADRTVPALVAALGDDRAQARSQALHTLSKIGDRRAWPAVTRELLTDPDDEVAKAAWRAAVALVPPGSEAELAGLLASQLGRGGRETQVSLSRAMIGLGEAIRPILRHAAATERLFHDPDAGFELGVEAANRAVAIGTKRAKG